MKNMGSKVATVAVALALSGATVGATAGADVLEGENAPSQAVPAELVRVQEAVQATCR